MDICDTHSLNGAFLLSLPFCCWGFFFICLISSSFLPTSSSSSSSSSFTFFSSTFSSSSFLLLSHFLPPLLYYLLPCPPVSLFPPLPSHLPLPLPLSFLIGLFIFSLSCSSRPFLIYSFLLWVSSCFVISQISLSCLLWFHIFTHDPGTTSKTQNLVLLARQRKRGKTLGPILKSFVPVAEAQKMSLCVFIFWRHPVCFLLGFLSLQVSLSWLRSLIGSGPFPWPSRISSSLPMEDCEVPSVLH